MVAHPRELLRTTGRECGGGKKGTSWRGARCVGRKERAAHVGGDAWWRHEMPWHRLPVCDGRESRYDLRSTTPPTSSVSRMKLRGSMVAIIRSRLARIAAQRGSDDALNMDFFVPSREIVTRRPRKSGLIIEQYWEWPSYDVNALFEMHACLRQ